MTFDASESLMTAPARVKTSKIEKSILMPLVCLRMSNDV